MESWVCVTGPLRSALQPASDDLRPTPSSVKYERRNVVLAVSWMRSCDGCYGSVACCRRW